MSQSRSKRNPLAVTPAQRTSRRNNGVIRFMSKRLFTETTAAANRKLAKHGCLWIDLAKCKRQRALGGNDSLDTFFAPPPTGGVDVLPGLFFRMEAVSCHSLLLVALDAADLATPFIFVATS